MPDNNRLFVTGLAVIAALLVASGLGGYWGSLYAPEHKQYALSASTNANSGRYEGPSESLPDVAGVPETVERAIANPRPISGADHEQRDLAAQESMAVWSFWMVCAALATFLVTSFGTILIWRQVVLTRRAVEDTAKATKAVERQNELAEDTAKRQLRAYVTVKTVFVEMKTFHSEPTVTVVMHNGGQTPAYDLQLGLGSIAHVASPADLFKCRSTGGRPFRSKLTIGPTTDKVATGELEIPPGKEPILDWNYLIFGVIIYRDAFSKRRITTFKYTISCKDVINGFGRGQIPMIACSKGNKAN